MYLVEADSREAGTLYIGENGMQSQEAGLLCNGGAGGSISHISNASVEQRIPNLCVLPS